MSIINALFEKCGPVIERACRRASDLAKNSQTFQTEGHAYLTRFYLMRHRQSGSSAVEPERFLGAYLHYFHRGDDDQALHDHPWRWSCSLILTNGYVEQRWDSYAGGVKIRNLRPGSLNVIRSGDFHRVDLMDPSKGCWTLFFSGPRVRENWGFWQPGVHKFVPHHSYQRRRLRNVRPGQA